MSNKLFYPALFHKAEEGGFWVTFPDFPECFTEGDNMEEAYEMAFEVLGLAITDKLKNNEPLPTSSSFENIVIEKDSFLAIVEFDKLAYNKKHNSKAVKKART